MMQKRTWTDVLSGLLTEEETSNPEATDTLGDQRKEGDQSAETPERPTAPEEECLPVYGPLLRLGDRLRIQREERKIKAQQEALEAKQNFESKMRRMDGAEGAALQTSSRQGSHIKTMPSP